MALRGKGATFCPCGSSAALVWNRFTLSGADGCYVGVKSPAQAGLCLGDGAWAVLIGDSTTRSLTFSLLKMLLQQDMGPDPVKWLGLAAPAGNYGIDVGWLDATLVKNGSAWVRRSIQSGAKASVIAARDPGGMALLPQAAVDAAAPRPLLANEIRITYVMTHTLAELIDAAMPRLANAVSVAEHVVIGGGHWDLAYATRHERAGPWFTSNKINTSDQLVKSSNAYASLFSRAAAQCGRRSQGCTWLTPSRLSPQSHKSRAMVTAAATMWYSIAATFPSFKVLNRWETTPPGHYVDRHGAHTDNFVNRWHTHLLLTSVCPSSSTRCFDTAPKYSLHGACAPPKNLRSYGRKVWAQSCDIVMH